MHIIIKPFLIQEKIRQLLHLGTTTDADRNFTIIAVNSISAVIILINLVLAPLFAAITGSWNILSGAMIEIFFVAYVLFSNARHKHELANIILFIILSLATVYFSAILGRTSSAELMIFFLVALSFFLFPDVYMRIICGALTICSLSFIEFNYKYNTIPSIEVAEQLQDYIRWGAYFAISTLIILLFTFYTRKKETRVFHLKEQNGALKKEKKKLGKKIKEYDAVRFDLVYQIQQLKAENKRLREEVMVYEECQDKLQQNISGMAYEIQDLREGNDFLEEEIQFLVLNVMDEKKTNTSLADYLFFAAHDAERNIGPIEKASDFLRLKFSGNGQHLLPDQNILLSFLNHSIRQYKLFVANLFYVAKLEAKRIDAVVIEPITIKRFFSDIIMQMDEQAILGSPGIQFIQSPGLPEIIHSDSSMLRQILMNLLFNAKQHTKGQIFVILGHTATHLSFSVVNEGNHIDPSLLERIFDKYFTTNRTKGQGVGLTIAKSLSMALGGNISVQNQDNIGPCFTVMIPFDISGLTYLEKMESWDAE